MGDVAASAGLDDPFKERVGLTYDLAVKQSVWIAARAEAHNGSVGHTLPIYVTADGKPALATSKLDELVPAKLRRLEKPRALIHKKMDEKDPIWTRVGEELLDRIDRAEAYYRGLKEANVQ